MQSISATILKQRLDNNEDIQLIDVREIDEHAAFNIGGELIPLGEIIQKIEKIAKDKPVVLYCRKGIRSQIAFQRMQPPARKSFEQFQIIRRMQRRKHTLNTAQHLRREALAIARFNQSPQSLMPHRTDHSMV